MEARRQGLPLFAAFAVLIGLVVVVQLWLLEVSIDAFQSREPAVAEAAAGASAVLLALNGALLAYIRAFDRRLTAAAQRDASSADLPRRA
jgi:hypothetical protein